LKYTSSTYI